MNRKIVGGYQGPVVVLTADGVEVARAACRYRVEAGEWGADHWTGRLHRIAPPGAIVAGDYSLRLPEGSQGAITITAVAAGAAVAFFEGIGTRPC